MTDVSSVAKKEARNTGCMHALCTNRFGWKSQEQHADTSNKQEQVEKGAHGKEESQYGRVKRGQDMKHIAR